MTPEFDQLVDLEGLGPDELGRLQKVHKLLVAAGPPAELPARLVQAPENLNGKAHLDTGGTVLAFPARTRKRSGMMLLAAAVAATCFGGGYVLANQTHKSAIQTVRIVPMKGEQNSLASASIRVGSGDGDGNLPIQLTVSGLPQPQNVRYYLMLWQNGKPSGVCGTFVVGKSGSTTVAFNVPYKITKSTRWVITEMKPGLQYPGHVVMTTS